MFNVRKNIYNDPYKFEDILSQVWRVTINEGPVSFLPKN